MAAKNRSGYRHIRVFLEQGPVLDVGCARGEDLETMPSGSVGLEIVPVYIPSHRIHSMASAESRNKERTSC